MLATRKRGKSGFTIVELLIVIVVIAILAAITIVAFNGIQQRANNTAKISAVKGVIRLVKGYTATYSVLPGTATRCATVDNQCTNSTGTAQTTDNTALMDELRKIGTPPTSPTTTVNNAYGIQYIYEAGMTFNGTLAPIRIEYWLQGDNQPCGVENVQNNNLTTPVSSTTGYTSSGSGRTSCWVRLGVEV